MHATMANLAQAGLTIRHGPGLLDIYLAKHWMHGAYRKHLLQLLQRKTCNISLNSIPGLPDQASK